MVDKLALELVVGMVEQLVKRRENVRVESLDNEKAAVLVLLKVEM